MVSEAAAQAFEEHNWVYITLLHPNLTTLSSVLLLLSFLLLLLLGMRHTKVPQVLLIVIYGICEWVGGIRCERSAGEDECRCDDIEQAPVSLEAHSSTTASEV